jgi:putative polyhydroxyalkanoic acid system protein
VRITVSHNRAKEEVMQSVDRSFNELFQGVGLPQLKLTEARRSWQGNTLTFSLTAKMGWISTPIKGTVEVTDQDLTIDADLGLLERLIPAAKAREMVSSRIRGLLN